jgi:hypothetical protein
VIGTISRNAYAISGAVADTWERLVVREGRDANETASYVLRRRNGSAGTDAPAGIRVVGADPNQWLYDLTVPRVRELDFSKAVTIGEAGGTVVERVFDIKAFTELRDYVMGDLDNERMAALHGELWLTPDSEGKLVPYVLYEGFVPLQGESTATSVRIEAGDQSATAGHQLSLAGLVHSHPHKAKETEAQGRAQEVEDDGWGPCGVSPTDVVVFRRALRHVWQSTWVAALPKDPAEPIRLLPYGYGNGGRVVAESGFWVVDKAKLRRRGR